MPGRETLEAKMRRRLAVSGEPRVPLGGGRVYTDNAKRVRPQRALAPCLVLQQLEATKERVSTNMS